ncbi:DUF6000 family protein [Myceligenerans indicum]|uniref:Uncharacterized protein n=1 Tax=Myceligenerans indicum TaxID=2593663 RepID=A0ABS1LPZ5_9MICO|nr:DUF6000 family protein [Myceligenerans indicum]MBL0888305.1 hypothetical protein [Myceligenerans indicum]
MRAYRVRRDPLADDYTRAEIRLLNRLVRPFYLKMYLVEAPDEVDPRAARRFRRALLRAGRTVTAEQVVWLLQGRDWRELTIGAWFALAVPVGKVRRAVVDAWGSVPDGHAAGPLVTVSVLIAGPDAVAGMRSFVERLDGHDVLGTAGYASAAIAHLGGSPPLDPGPMVVASLDDSLSVAADLQCDFRAVRRARWRHGGER